MESNTIVQILKIVWGGLCPNHGFRAKKTDMILVNNSSLELTIKAFYNHVSKNIKILLQYYIVQMLIF